MKPYLLTCLIGNVMLKQIVLNRQLLQWRSSVIVMVS